MKYLESYSLYEKSSLIGLGVPLEVVRYVQYDYEMKPNAKWTNLPLKRDVLVELAKSEKSLFVEISFDYIKIIVNLGDNKYYQQYYMYDVEGWGGYEKRDREYISKSKVIYGISAKSNVYKLDGSFEVKEKKQRRIQKETKEFDEITNEFKFYILYNFNKIIQRIYGKRYDYVMKQIAKNISKINKESTADEILKFLKDNKKMAEKAKEYEDAKNDEDLLRLKNLEKKYNSLPIIDEYLFKFEDEYSTEFNTRLNIKDLIDDFGKMKIETAFMYYLFTGKIKELAVQTKK